MNCKDCIHYRNIYIHPWSECPENLKRSKKGYACLAMAEKSVDVDEPRVSVVIGREDLKGCEWFDIGKQ